MASDPISVRPTRRCLADLAVDLPDLGVPLDEIEDPVIVSAQALPEQRDAGGAERVVSLTDRVWFKVKTSDRRAVVTELRESELRSGSRRAVVRGGSGQRDDVRTTAHSVTSTQHCSASARTARPSPPSICCRSSGTGSA